MNPGVHTVGKEPLPIQTTLRKSIRKHLRCLSPLLELRTSQFSSLGLKKSRGNIRQEWSDMIIDARAGFTISFECCTFLLLLLLLFLYEEFERLGAGGSGGGRSWRQQQVNPVLGGVKVGWGRISVMSIIDSPLTPRKGAATPPIFRKGIGGYIANAAHSLFLFAFFFSRAHQVWPPLPWHLP